MNDDQPTYRTHCRETERWFRPTGNPVLIGIAERLVEAGASLRRSPVTTVSTLVADAVPVASHTTVDSSRSWSELRRHREGSPEEQNPGVPDAPSLE